MTWSPTAHRRVLGVAVLAAVAAGLWQVVPPAPPEKAAETQFDVERAMAHVRVIAKQPHPNGSPANAQVREYLLAQLRSMGFDPQVQTRPVRRQFDNSLRTVHNILLRIPGTGRHDNALLLTAHYDSNSRAPGAGDDASGVASILETLRVLKATSHVPKRDLIVLLSDGEEIGLLGAKAFCGDPLGDPSRPIEDATTEPRPIKDYAAPTPRNQTYPPHPWLKDVAIVLSFEARGASGPSIMFEATPGHLGLIREFARAAPYPVASSPSYEVYRLIRNDTDFTIFRRAGLQGLNFAFIADQLHYHRPTDTPENLYRRTLYHHGTYALSLTRHLTATGGPPLDDPRNAVWFNLWRWILVWYPATWVWPLTILQILVTAAAIALLRRRRMITGRGLAGAAIRLVLSLVLATSFVFTTQLLLVPQGPVRKAWHFDALTALFALIAASVAAASMLLWLRRTRGQDLIVVGLILWSCLGVLASYFAPGATYLTAWPTLFAALGLLVESKRPWLRTLIAAIAVAPAAYLFTPMLYLAFVALTLHLSAPLAGVIALVTWLIAPYFALTPDAPLPLPAVTISSS